MQREYELVVILNPEVKGEEREKLLAKIKKFITDSEGKISEAKEWGKKVLVYPIAKKQEGFFYCLTFSLPLKEANSVKQKIQQEDLVLRFLMVNKESRLLR